MTVAPESTNRADTQENADGTPVGDRPINRALDALSFRGNRPSDWIESDYPCHAHCRVDEDDRHGMAALCLHEQPFGFTRDDVVELREIAEDYEHRGLPDPHPFDVLRNLADRIDALLPPEAE